MNQVHTFEEYSGYNHYLLRPVQVHSLLPERSCFTAHLAETHQNWIHLAFKSNERVAKNQNIMLHLLIAGPLKQSIRSLQADVRRFQGDLRDGEAGHIGGDQGGVAAYALPSIKVLRDLKT